MLKKSELREHFSWSAIVLFDGGSVVTDEKEYQQRKDAGEKAFLNRVITKRIKSTGSYDYNERDCVFYDEVKADRDLIKAFYKGVEYNTLSELVVLVEKLEREKAARDREHKERSRKVREGAISKLKEIFFPDWDYSKYSFTEYQWETILEREPCFIKLWKEVGIRLGNLVFFERGVFEADVFDGCVYEILGEFKPDGTFDHSVREKFITYFKNKGNISFTGLNKKGRELILSRFEVVKDGGMCVTVKGDENTVKEIENDDLFVEDC